MRNYRPKEVILDWETYTSLKERLVQAEKEAEESLIMKVEIIQKLQKDKTHILLILKTEQPIGTGNIKNMYQLIPIERWEEMDKSKLKRANNL